MNYHDGPPSYDSDSDVENGLLRNYNPQHDVPDLVSAMEEGDNGGPPRPATQRPPPAGELSSEEVSDHEQQQPSKKQSKEPVAWKDLPRKKQLIIITLARMSEPLVQTSLQVCQTLLLHKHAHHTHTPLLPSSCTTYKRGRKKNKTAYIS